MFEDLTTNHQGSSIDFGRQFVDRRHAERVGHLRIPRAGFLNGIRRNIVAPSLYSDLAETAA